MQPGARDVEAPVVSWSQVVQQSGDGSVPFLSLRNLTEYDPSLCVYRDGQWVHPDDGPSTK